MDLGAIDYLERIEPQDMAWVLDTQILAKVHPIERLMTVGTEGTNTSMATVISLSACVESIPAGQLAHAPTLGPWSMRVAEASQSP